MANLLIKLKRKEILRSLEDNLIMTQWKKTKFLPIYTTYYFKSKAKDLSIEKVSRLPKGLILTLEISIANSN